MAAYATVADLTNYGVMSAKTFGDLTGPQLQAAIDAANDTADSYLAARFKLPLTSWGKALTQKVVAIARFELLTQRGFAPEGDHAAAIVEAKKDAIRWFEGIADGTITPQVVDQTNGKPGGPFTAQGTADPMNPGGFVVSKPAGRDW